MAKLLIEYKGIPAIIDHNFETIEEMTFIVTYKSEDNIFLRKDFKSIDAALDFEPDNESKLVFVYLTSKTGADNLHYALYKNIEFVNNRFIIRGWLFRLYKGFYISIDFGFDSFRIGKAGGPLGSGLNLYYSRRKTIKKDNKKEFELVDSFYELVPRYEDIFLETIFFFDILKSNLNVTDKDEIEAYFLQAKLKLDDKKKTP